VRNRASFGKAVAQKPEAEEMIGSSFARENVGLTTLC
jgi:hypothetical protein